MSVARQKKTLIAKLLDIKRACAAINVPSFLGEK